MRSGHGVLSIAGAQRRPGSAGLALAEHWPEYLMEATQLGLFMASACVLATLLEHPASPLHQAVVDPTSRRLIMGLGMGLTAIGLIYSPWGKQSGAHLNPAVTLTFLRLGKVTPWDAAFYAAAQFAGGALGVAAAALLLGGAVGHPAVQYVVTQPGRWGTEVAFAAEFLMAFVLMSVVLRVSNSARWARLTGCCAGLLVCIYIGLAAPLSGMSMNPARSFASSLNAHVWSGLWLYFVAPPLGMLGAAEAYRRWAGRPVLCAKLHHQNARRCIFRCGYRGAAR